MKTKRNHRPVGIIDIGSNSIRLCVYDAATRVPVPLFNEKAVCSLAQGLEATGRLNADGIAPALLTIGRFVELSMSMEVERLDILATAAVRDAADGIAFAQAIEQRFGVVVHILSGGQEAHLSAMGVLCGAPDAKGIVCDLGGGSLELVSIDGGTFSEHVTLPLGVLRLAEASGYDRPRAAAIIERHLDGLDWLHQGRDLTLYAVGGAWRALARLSIAHTLHPLTVLDNFTLERDEALRITHLVASQSRKSLDKLPGVSRKRVTTLPLAAQVLEQIIERVGPKRLVFSIYGMREGRFFESLPDSLKAEDPLLSVCRQTALTNCRFPEHGDEVMAWMSPLFPDESPHDARLRHAACLLSDTFWNEHPDYRAEQAFLRTLRLPYMGVPHEERAAIALTVFIRYQGDEDDLQFKGAYALMDEATLERCRVMGVALRLAHTLSGGAPNLLRQTSIAKAGKELVLTVPADAPVWMVDPDRSFDRLTRLLECETMVVRRV